MPGTPFGLAFGLPSPAGCRRAACRQAAEGHPKRPRRPERYPRPDLQRRRGPVLHVGLPALDRHRHPAPPEYPASPPPAPMGTPLFEGSASSPPTPAAASPASGFRSGPLRGPNRGSYRGIPRRQLTHPPGRPAIDTGGVRFNFWRFSHRQSAVPLRRKGRTGGRLRGLSPPAPCPAPLGGLVQSWPAGRRRGGRAITLCELTAGQLWASVRRGE